MQPLPASETAMHRLRPALALLLAWLPAAPLHGQPDTTGVDSTWRDHSAAGESARASGDWANYRYHLVRMREEIGYHPAILYGLARADARLGRVEDAVLWLRTYGATGLVREISTDADLAVLRGDSAWASLVDQLERVNGQPVSSGQLAFTLPDAEFMPEGIAHDAGSGRFFVSSARTGRILAHVPGGAFSEFVPAARDSQWSMLALAVDSARGTLWAVTSALPAYRGLAATDSGRSAVLAYDLATGALRRRIEAPDDAAHAFGDITVAPDGEVFVSDAMAGVVFRIEAGGEDLEPMAADELVSPQGLAVTSDGRRLLVADYVRGIAIVERATGAVSWLEHGDSVVVAGTDGLVRVGHSLIAVQNGVTPKRVVLLRLDEAERRVVAWLPLESATPLLSEPTQAVVVGRDLYFIANAGWDRLADDGTVREGTSLEPGVVLRVRLPD